MKNAYLSADFIAVLVRHFRRNAMAVCLILSGMYAKYAKTVSGNVPLTIILYAVMNVRSFRANDWKNSVKARLSTAFAITLTVFRIYSGCRRRE